MHQHVAPGVDDDRPVLGKPARARDRGGGRQSTLIEIAHHPEQSRRLAQPVTGKRNSRAAGYGVSAIAAGHRRPLVMLRRAPCPRTCSAVRDGFGWIE